MFTLIEDNKKEAFKKCFNIIYHSYHTTTK